MSKTPFLALRGIQKSFGGVRALTDVSLDVYPGEVHAIVGENGAGKSTLMRIVAGALQPDSGEITIEGHVHRFTGPRDAARRGIAMVYQEPTFCPDLTVLENFFLGEELISRSGDIRWREMYRRAAGVLEEMGLPTWVLDRPMAELSLGNQQMVLIARGLYRNARLLILDEPTSILSHAETQVLFRTVRRLRAEGRSVLYISHRLHEIMELCDRATVLRDGQVVGRLDVRDANEETIIQLMSGRSIDQHVYVPRNIAGHPPLLEVRNLTLEGMYRDVSLTVRPGEVLGVYGLVGSGRTEVGLTIFGRLQADRGTIRFDRKVIQPRSPREAMRLGISYTPEDRRTQGLFSSRSVADNLSVALLGRLSWWGWVLDRARETEQVLKQIQQLAIKTDGPRAAVSSLSGGNQQKVVLARWLGTQPRLLILDEPTRGVDVGTKTEIHRLVMDLARRGVAVILISSDLAEVLALADNILVMHDGAVSGYLSRTEATEAAVLRCALGLDGETAGGGLPPRGTIGETSTTAEEAVL